MLGHPLFHFFLFSHFNEEFNFCYALELFTIWIWMKSDILIPIILKLGLSFVFLSSLILFTCTHKTPRRVCITSSQGLGDLKGDSRFLGLYWLNHQKRSRLWTSEQWRERTRTAAIYMRTPEKRAFTFLASTDAKMHNRTWWFYALLRTKQTPLFTYFEGKVKKGESRKFPSNSRGQHEFAWPRDNVSLLSTAGTGECIQPSLLLLMLCLRHPPLLTCRSQGFKLT